jgi:hypothetical protein
LERIRRPAAKNDVRGAAPIPYLAVPIPYIEDVEWLCKRVDVLEEERNNALDSPLWAYQRGPNEAVVMPLVALGHVRAKKLSEKIFWQSSDGARTDLLILLNLLSLLTNPFPITLFHGQIDLSGQFVSVPTTRPSRMSSIHLRALAIAASKASRLSGLIAGLAEAHE